MKKVFLTGATGFLGSYVARLLVKKYQVIAIHRKSSRFDLVQDIKHKIEWIECDLEKILGLDEIFGNIDIVIHCAAVVSFLPQDRMLMQRINVEATRELVDLSLAQGVERFVHISSIAALGRHKNDEKIDEKAEWQDGPLNTYYGISKQMAEREVWRGSAEGLNMIILNPSLIMGAGYWAEGSPAIAKQLEKGLSFYPTGSTGLVDVRDVAELCVKAIDIRQNNLRIIASAGNRTYEEFMSSIATKFGKKKPSIPLNSLLVAIAWRAELFLSKLLRRKPLISKDSLMAASKNGLYDNSLSKEKFNHDYRTIETTLNDLVVCYNKSKALGTKYGILPYK